MNVKDIFARKVTMHKALGLFTSSWCFSKASLSMISNSITTDIDCSTRIIQLKSKSIVTIYQRHLVLFARSWCFSGGIPKYDQQ